MANEAAQASEQLMSGGRGPAEPIDVAVVAVPAEARALEGILKTKAGAKLHEAWQAQQANGRAPRGAGGKALDSVRIAKMRSALRCSEQSSPGLHAIVRRAQMVLGCDLPYEIYVQSDPLLNASCSWARDRMIVSFTDGLLRAMSPDELLMVVGHEVGHYLSPAQKFGAWLYGTLDELAGNPELLAQLEHEEDPVASSIFARGLPPQIALHSRAAELTSDRLGLLCCQDLDVAVGALAKLHGGADVAIVRVQARDYLAQADELIAAGAGWDEQTSDHPLGLLRAKALQAFHESDLYGRYFPQPATTMSASAANAFVDELLARKPTGEAIGDDDRLTELAAMGCVMVSLADGKVTAAEKRRIKELPVGDRILERWDEIAEMSEARFGKKLDALIDYATHVHDRRRLSTIVGWWTEVARADRQFSEDETRSLFFLADRLGVLDLARKRLTSLMGFDPYERLAAAKAPDAGPPERAEECALVELLMHTLHAAHPQGDALDPSQRLETLFVEGFSDLDWLLVVLALEIDTRRSIPDRLAGAGNLTLGEFAARIDTLDPIDDPAWSYRRLALLAGSMAERAEKREASARATKK